jgi:hypothetical protein
MLDRGDARFFGPPPGTLLQAELIPRFGYFVGEVGLPGSPPVLEFAGSMAVEKCATALTLSKNEVLPRPRRSIRVPTGMGGSLR